MSLDTSEILVLSAFLWLGQEDQAATVIRLSARTGLPRDAVQGALAALDRSGWVDLPRLGLTLPGLALAVAVEPRAQKLVRALAA